MPAVWPESSCKENIMQRNPGQVSKGKNCSFKKAKARFFKLDLFQQGHGELSMAARLLLISTAPENSV